jgi:hypothetical protein
VVESAIAAAESRLGVEFADTYRTFLRRYGGAMLGDGPVLGLARAEVMGNDLWSVVEATERFRNEMWPGVSAWYMISVDGAGNPIGVNEDGEVWLSDHDTHEFVRIAGSVEEFLRRKLSGG